MADPRAGRFSSGFAAGGALVQGKFEQEQAAKQQQLDQQNLDRENAKANVAESLEILQKSSKDQSAAYFTSKGNNDQKGMETAIAVQTRAAQELWKSNEAMLRRIGTPEDVIANIKERFRIGAALNNPAAESKLIAAGEAEAKVPAAVDAAQQMAQNASGIDIAESERLAEPEVFIDLQTGETKRAFLKNRQFIEEGTNQPLPNNMVRLKDISGIEGGPDALTAGGKNKLLTENIAAETSLRKNFSMAEDLKNLVTSPDFIGGNIGGMMSSVNSAVAQIQAVTGTKPVIESDAFLSGKQLNLDMVAEDASDETLSQLRKWAISDDREDSLSLNLAFIVAEMLNPDGKISDADVRAAQGIIGKSADPASRVAVINDLQQRMLRNFNIEQDVLSRRASGSGISFKPITMDDLLGKANVDFGSTDEQMQELERLEKENTALEKEVGGK